MEELIARTIALNAIAGDIHYQALLEQKWDVHKQMDEIRDNIKDWFDDLQEIIMVPIFSEYAISKEYLKKSSEYCFEIESVEDGKTKFVDFLIDYLKLLTNLNKDADLGTQNLLSTMAQYIQQFIGWINKV